MRIVANESSYDTRAVRRVLQAVARTFRRKEGLSAQTWARLRVRLLAGRAQSVRGEGNNQLFNIYLPPLRGTEFINIARAQHGGVLNDEHGGLRALDLALILQTMLFGLIGGHRRSWWKRVLMDEKRTLHGIPVLVALRIVKPKPPRDKLQERLERTRELEKSWQRKAKLAATKIKKLKQRRLRYEKQLAQRQEG